jgi:hypothetical protein
MSKFATGLLAGLGQGLGVMGGGMLRDIQADDDEARAQRRAKMLAEIQRENQRTLRQDDLDFKTDPKNVERVRAVAKGDELAKFDPELVGARAAARSGEIRGTAQAEAEAAGKRQAAISDETLRELYPGQVLTRGGKRVEENTRPTSQEVQGRLYDEGLKTSGRGGGGSSSYERMDEADKVQVQETNREINDISSAMTKGLADGSLSADKADPGYKSYQALMVQRRQAEMARDAVMRKYAEESPGSSAPREDPLGLRGGAGGGTGGGSKAPAGGTSGGQIDPKDNRAKILADELKKARAAGNADDVKALQSEVDKLPKDVRQAVLDRIRNDSAAPAPAPAPAAPNKAPAQAPAPAPAAAAQSPGLLSQLGNRLSAWQASNAAEGARAEALRAKIRRGERLTPEEQQEARRLGVN